MSKHPDIVNSEKFNLSHNRLWSFSDYTISRVSTFGLLGVLLSLTSFAIWTSVSTSRLSDDATICLLLSNNYAAAATAVAAEESLERKFRLEPSPQVRQRYDKAADNLVKALQEVSKTGTAEDHDLVDEVLAKHELYLQAIKKMFLAVTSGDIDQATKIDSDEVDPRFEAIESLITRAADKHHKESLDTLDKLHERENFNAHITPIVFVSGLLFVVLFSRVLHRTRIQLDEQRRQAVHGSLHDALTGLANRTLLNDRIELALRNANRTGIAFGLFLIDLDQFKEVNDTLGHHFGDQLLFQVGRRLAAELREIDTIARLGGDEFAVVIPDVDTLESALITARRLHDAMTKSFLLQEVDIDIEASIGVVVSGLHGNDAVLLLQRADVAMYAAKNKHLGVCSYNEDTDPHSTERLSLLGQLRRGIERDELILQYQPKIQLNSGAFLGVEALVRWQHPERGIVPPIEFIPFAEHTGLIGPLTQKVIDMALAQVRAWADAGHNIAVSVNISPRNLLDVNIVDEIAALLSRHGVAAEQLELEITESAIMLEPERARQLLQRLHNIGVRIAIDDFGVGYTSLSQLRHLPISVLKIDKSFVFKLGADPKNGLIVRSIVELGHNLGFQITAEGVEDAATQASLLTFGCDQAQGFLYSRPTSAEDILRQVTNSASTSANVKSNNG